MLFVGEDVIISARCDVVAPAYPRCRAYCFMASLIR
jgi:hypothetical protein